MSSLPLENSKGHAGSLNQFFNSNPEIYTKIVGYYFSKKSKDEKFKKINTLHEQFVKICRSSGIKESEYPLNTVSNARTAFYSFIKKLTEQQYSEYLITHQDKEAVRAQNFSDFSDFFISFSRPYERVEIDGHKIDLRINARIQEIDGSFSTKEVERIWIIACIDKASRAILGYHLAFTREYSAADVLIAIRNSIHPWKHKELTLPCIDYGLGAGFPSGLIKPLKWALFDEISLDNAKSHLSHVVIDNLTGILNCAFNDGPAATPEIRGIVERFFGTLEERGMHRLPGTTGDNPRDKRRVHGDESVVVVEELEDLIEVLIANYNATSHSSNNDQSPLKYLERYFSNNRSIIRYLPEHLRESNSIASFTIERTVRGSKEEGKRPYIQYERAIYKSIVLSSSFSLIGEKLTLVVDITDLRVLKAFLSNGEELGQLMVQGSWSESAHDLKMRKSINQLVSQREITLSKTDDPILSYIEYLADKSKSSKRAANMYLKAKKIANSNVGGTYQIKTLNHGMDDYKGANRPKKKVKRNKSGVIINRTMDY